MGIGIYEGNKNRPKRFINVFCTAIVVYNEKRAELADHSQKRAECKFTAFKSFWRGLNRKFRHLYHCPPRSLLRR